MLTSIRLGNFKCFQNEFIPLKPLTLLTGLNGMGKSSVIQALLLIKQSYEYRIAHSNSPWPLNGDYFELGTVRDILYQYFTKREISIEISQINSLGATSAKWLFDASNTETDALSVISGPSEAEVIPDFIFIPHFHYLNAERIGPRVYSQMSNQKVAYEAQLGVRGELAAHYLAINGDKPIRIPALRFPESDPDNPVYGLSLNEQVNAWLSLIRPGTRLSTTMYRDVSLVGLKYQFIAGSDRGNEFRPTNVGFGLSYILPLLISILISSPGSLLLFENPEAHLHPKGQAEIGRLIAMAAKENLQVIVETHSDHIMNGIRVAVRNGNLNADDCSFLYFTGETIQGKFQHYIEEIKLNQKGKLSHRPDGFFDEWDNLLTRLI